MERVRHYIKSWYQSIKNAKWRRAFLGLSVILGLSIIFLVLWALSECIDVNVISAFITVLLALAAFLAIWNTSSIYRHSRQKEMAKERRDRDERLLNEIIEWAIEVVKVGMPTESTVAVGKMDEEVDRRLVQNMLNNLRNNFRALIAVSLYVTRIGLAFGEKLQSSIAKLDGDLRKQEDILIKFQKIVTERNQIEFAETSNELANNWDVVGESAANVIDEAIIEKLSISP
jgi:hypothetical protein